MNDASRLTELCAECGADLPSAANFCPACGARSVATEPEPEGLGATLKEFASGTVDEVQSALSSDLGQTAAAGALIGAAASILLPISLGAGALIGAGLFAYNKLKK